MLFPKMITRDKEMDNKFNRQITGHGKKDDTLIKSYGKK
jgi:phosphoheptose isomerase